VAGRMQRASPRPGSAGQQRGELLAADDARVELVGVGVLQPPLLRGGLLLVFGDIDAAGLAEAGIAFDRAVEAAPDAQRFDDERQFARIAPLLAAEPPVAARLLAGDVAF